MPTAAQIDAWNKQNGFNDPLIVQYLRYMNNLLHGNLGFSYAENQTVASLFGERLARSIYLSGISLLHRDPDRPAAGHLPGREAELAR